MAYKTADQLEREAQTQRAALGAMSRRTGSADTMERQQQARIRRIVSQGGTADAMERRIVAAQRNVPEARAAQIIGQQVDQRRAAQGYGPVYTAPAPTVTTTTIPLAPPSASTYEPGSGAVQAAQEALPQMPNIGAPESAVMPQGDAFTTGMAGGGGFSSSGQMAGRLLRDLMPSNPSPLRDLKLGFGVVSRGFKPSQAFKRIKQ